MITFTRALISIQKSTPANKRSVQTKECGRTGWERVYWDGLGKISELSVSLFVASSWGRFFHMTRCVAASLSLCLFFRLFAFQKHNVFESIALVSCCVWITALPGNDIKVFS